MRDRFDVCLWIKYFLEGYFKILVLSSILFFGIYGVVLLIFREEMVIEIVNIVIKKKDRRKDE